VQALLGYGIDGTVWSTNGETAIKVFERHNNYSRELACYERLFETGTSYLGEFSVPSLIDHDTELLAIEISIVRPPYLLDFGKAYLDQPPDFSSEVIADWEVEKSALFEPEQWATVKSLIGQLRALGIYYFDAKPANIAFD
jgi:hypothetical protein